MGGCVVLTLFESRHVARGRGDLGQVDAHVDRDGLDEGAAAGAELSVLVAAPGPEPAGAVDRVAGVAARAPRGGVVVLDTGRDRRLGRRTCAGRTAAPLACLWVGGVP